MKHLVVAVFLLRFLTHSTALVSSCPLTVFPCFCSSSEEGATTVICAGTQNASHLEEATKPLKSLIVDNLYLLNTFVNSPDADYLSNDVDPKQKIETFEMFPKKWLSEVRVRNLEIQGAKLNGYFLCDDAFEGQADFLTSLVIKNAGLRGHVCSTCSPPSPTIAFSTKELKRTPLLKYVDLSHNQLEVLDGAAFPSGMKELKKIILSNNHIFRVHDNAFSNLPEVTHIDLSRNRIKAVSRKVFPPVNSTVHTIDISYNSIQSLPKDIFLSMISLKEVRLSHNLLETLPVEVWSRIPALMEKIDLRGNFLVCNCTTSWILRHINKATKLYGHCVAPRNVAFQELKASLPTIASCK